TGTLQASAPPAPFVSGARHAIPQLGDLTLTDVQVVTSAQNPAIAAGRAQVQIRMAAPAGVDWPTWLPVLRCFDGSAARSATVAEADGTTTLAYDVPMSVLGHAEESLWQITAPSDDGLGAAYRWAFPLALP
ncbi:hypothetical protein K2Z83_25880, partial [Oscillochloris sp. ZM17-4]|uniref:hypothetical protein n=1 Tax=Oscillochloris sp. ZM17-4 TaxID=2866714 RepID=UPI001C733CB9